MTGHFDSKAFKEHYTDFYRQFAQQYNLVLINEKAHTTACQQSMSSTTEAVLIQYTPVPLPCQSLL